jgi:hypothetical protein
VRFVTAAWINDCLGPHNGTQYIFVTALIPESDGNRPPRREGIYPESAHAKSGVTARASGPAPGRVPIAGHRKSTAQPPKLQRWEGSHGSSCNSLNVSIVRNASRDCQLDPNYPELSHEGTGMRPESHYLTDSFHGSMIALGRQPVRGAEGRKARMPTSRWAFKHYPVLPGRCYGRIRFDGIATVKTCS